MGHPYAVRQHLRHYDAFSRESSVLFVERAAPLLSDAHRADVLALYHRYEELLQQILRASVDAGEIRAGLDLKMAMMGLLGPLDTAGGRPAWREAAHATHFHPLTIRYPVVQSR